MTGQKKMQVSGKWYSPPLALDKYGLLDNEQFTVSNKCLKPTDVFRRGQNI